jgi:hypothetical protein
LKKSTKKLFFKFGRGRFLRAGPNSQTFFAAFFQKRNTFFRFPVAMSSLAAAQLDAGPRGG